MGKKSLIKSTAKKESSAKKGEEKTTKKAAPKTKKKAAAKTAVKTPAKNTSKAAPKKAAPKKATPKKTAAKKPAPPKSKTAPPNPKAAQKVSIKALVFKKFGAFQPIPVSKAGFKKPDALHLSAPPLISSTDTKEVERLRGLLFMKFDMDDITKAAKVPEPKTVRTETAVDSETVTNDLWPPRPQSPSGEPAASDAYITIEPDAQAAEKDPLAKPVKIALAVAAIIIFLLLAISYNNASKYYLHPKDNTLEIWRGSFSPKDTQFLIALPRTHQMDKEVKDVYTKEEVFPLIYNYYTEKADSALETKAVPDFESIKSDLDKAKDFVVTSEMEKSVDLKLNNIERMILLYKANVLLNKNTEEAIASAIKLLNRATKFTTNPTQADVISIKIERARELSAKLKGGAK
jgi:hypothetical protein